jgi:hypothetical protein
VCLNAIDRLHVDCRPHYGFAVDAVDGDEISSL